MADSTKTGLFLATWDIGSGKPGAAIFRLCATVDTVRKVVNGVCHMLQATSPPPDFTSDVKGDYTDDLKVTPEIVSHHLVHAIGTNLDAPNFRLWMVLNKDWQSGHAHVSYLQNEKWQQLENLPVKLVPNPTA